MTSETISDAYMSSNVPVSPTTSCYVHSWRETGLHCTTCQRPICSQCFVPAAVGQLCRACARQRVPVNYQVPVRKLLMVVPATIVFCLVMTGVMTWFLATTPLLPLYLTFFAAPFAADWLVRCLDWLSGGKRGRAMQRAVGWSIGVGTAPCVLLMLLVGDLLGALLLLGFLAIMISRVNAQLR